ncbi:hypothetical protein KBY93_11110 [Synechococcus sp. J7-Johnson]|uniref:DUF6603 domain-containing protein n=1 Tax=Synechococcus sp. J7-Johnson TaxID=2823737 RepID=UPI0020CF2DDF|nr:DUF6603 domain-containing protein [Synechococcus sp. J7-Johnson]MCP9841176.1 hypothetical protein [Synechococcus sp. J7-Johnson]
MSIPQLDEVARQLAGNPPVLLDINAAGLDFQRIHYNIFAGSVFDLTDIRDLEMSSNILSFSATLKSFGSLRNLSIQATLIDILANRYGILLINIYPGLTARQVVQQFQGPTDRNASDDLLDSYFPTLMLARPALILSSISFSESLPQAFFSSLIRDVLPAELICAGVNLPLAYQSSSNLSEMYGGLLSEIFGGKFLADNQLCGLIDITTSVALSDNEDNATLQPIKVTVPTSTEYTQCFSVSNSYEGDGLVFGSFRLSCERFGLKVRLNENALWPGTFVEGSVLCGGNSLSVIVEYDLYHKFLVVDFLRFPTLSEFLGHARLDAVTSHFPNSISSLLDIRLSEVRITYDIRGAEVSEISLKVSEESAIELIPGVLELKNSTLDLLIIQPFEEGRWVEGSLTGEWLVDSTAIIASLTFPQLTFRVALAPQESIAIDSISKLFGGKVILESNLRVVALEITGSITEKFFHVALEISSQPSVALLKSPDLEFKDIRVEVDSADSVTFFNLTSLVSLGGIDFLLAGQHDGMGWKLSAQTGLDQPIMLGKWIDSLATSLNNPLLVPESVKGASVRNVSISIDTGSKDFHFSIEATLPLQELAANGTAGKVAGGGIKLTLTLDLLHHGTAYESKFAGEFQFGGHTFDLFFARSADAVGATATTMVAAYQNRDGQKILLKDLLAELGADVSDVPDLSIQLNSALLALGKPADPKAASWALLGINIDGGLNLSNLPLIGKIMPPNQTLSLETQVLYLAQSSPSSKLVKDDVERVNALLPAGATPLPARSEGDPLIAPGIGLATTLHLGSEVIHLNLPLRIDKTDGIGASPENTGAEPVVATDSMIVKPSAASAPVTLPQGDLKWFPIHKTFGPAHFERIGAGLSAGNITFAMDASLNVGGLSLSLDGLGVSSPLDKFEPTFQLRGIGIDYDGGPVQIGGSFLHLGDNDFAGTALIKTEQLTISAIGEYAIVDGATSLFIYAVLDYPLGGPSFFFVTGLAAGFGYNRSLLMPAIDDLETFPLVAEATAGAGLPKDVMAELNKLGQYVPPDPGQYFLAVGVKFNSFKQINSFALLAVSFGKRFEIDVLGQSTLIVPAPLPGSAKVDPVAKVTIVLLARFIPDEGLLAIDARITPDSFILSEKCHLSGGFSFYTWFKGKHSGDFVVSLGGYHPAYAAPPHYPVVPRLAFTWQVAPELVVKGDAYFALTSHALMAGGHLEASYQSDSLRAYFKVGADFLISWQPYHYDAEAYINIGGSYDTALGTIHVDLGAHLHLWGPEFAGTAELDLYVATVHAHFGDQTPKEKAPIEWSEFQKGFLPEQKDMVGLALEDGMVAAGDPRTNHLGIINPKQLRLVTNSPVPSSKLQFGLPEELKSIDGKQVNMAPVGVEDVTSTHTVNVYRKNGRDIKNVSTEFQVESVIKKLPAALWGKAHGNSKPEVNAEEKFVDGVTGVRLSPKAPPKAHTTKTLESERVMWDVDDSPQPLPAEIFSRFTPDLSAPPVEGGIHEFIEQTVLQEDVVKARNHYLKALNLDPVNVRIGRLVGSIFNAELRLGSFARHSG